MSKPSFSEDDLKYAFGLPPEEAIAFFEKKGFVISWDWKEVWKESNTHAFTVAKAMKVDVLADIYNGLLDSLKRGESFEVFLENLKPLLMANGWWGKKEFVNKRTGEISNIQLGSPYRLQTIYQTNLQTAYMVGRYKSMRAASAMLPYWEYVAIMDSRTRPSHAALNGRVFRADDPIWNVIYPPNGFRCRCRVTAHTESAKDRGDFDVSDSTGHMTIVDKTWKNREGKEMRVQIQSYKDPVTGKIFSPDAGWDYNPGKAAERAQKLLNDKISGLPDPLKKSLHG